MIKTLLIFLACLSIASCIRVELQDSSLDPEYAGLIGQQIRIKEDLWATGITTAKNYEPRLDYIVLVPGVGFGGPEVVSKERFGKGEIVKIVRVLTAKSPLVSRVKYVVEEVSSSKFKGIEIRILVPGSIDDGNLGLNEAIYERVDGTSRQNSEGKSAVEESE